MSHISIADLSKEPEVTAPHPYDFPLDTFQKYAINAIASDENVLVCAKTGSGKTLVGEYQIWHSLNMGKRVFYTTPIKSLSNQKFNDLKKQFNHATVGIMTGDIKFSPNAQIVIMTTEILRNLLYKRGTSTEHLGLTATISLDDVDAVIFDECHYINDRDRGKIWEETMILLPSTINMVMLSATLAHPEYLAGWLSELKGRRVHLIEAHHRVVPLTHYVMHHGEELDKNLVVLMDEKENYNDVAYAKWLHHKKKADDAYAAHQLRVAHRGDGPMIPKSNEARGVTHFIHQMNKFITLLEKNELLPALFFVFSRKQCERYASKVEQTLLSSSDVASVKHIISFHIHRYLPYLERVPQYHQLYSLLCRGIAFHHSGLLPLLKEIVEILFTKGLVRLMFCTETFAVGLNMPTKTVIFAGLKKYDEQMKGMRLLRNDEYFQMAGRAGRRGKDDKGVVIYMPDREPVTAQEMQFMMKGSKPAVVSRMDFHYEFILKTLQLSSADETLRWQRIMKNSYWFQLIQDEIGVQRNKRDQCIAALDALVLDDVYMKGCMARLELDSKYRKASNAMKRDAQRQLDILKNSQTGPKWDNAWKKYNEIIVLSGEKEGYDNALSELEDYQYGMDSVVEFLYEMKYVSNKNVNEITNNDLTLKGILATEINEGHPIIMTELYTACSLHALPAEEIIAILACFIGERCAVSDWSGVTPSIVEGVQNIERMIETYKLLESKIGYPLDNYWAIYTEMVEPMYRWICGDDMSAICATYEIFEGNMMRSIMKMVHIVDEWIAMATYCMHVEQIDKMMGMRSKLIRDVIVSESLYLSL